MPKNRAWFWLGRWTFLALVAGISCGYQPSAGTADQTVTGTDNGSQSPGGGPNDLQPDQEPRWPPLPDKFPGDFTMDMPTMKKLVGDSIALPIAGQFKTLSVTAVEDDGTVLVKPLILDAKLGDQRFNVTITALHSHAAADAQGRYAMTGEGSQAPQVAFVWHDFNVKLADGGGLNLKGVFHERKLLGYSYNPTELANLKAGAAIPVFGSTGWQVVKVMGPPTGKVLKLADGAQLRLLQAPDARVGLVP